ncbi:MAG: hypothetical protein ACWA5P_10450 [bacterium]
MLDWFTDLNLVSKVYWATAIVGSFIFIITMIIAFIGGDADDVGDIDSDLDGDIGAGFQFISFKNLVGFFTIFGWSGIACIDEGLTLLPTILISVLSGLLMMAIMASLFYFIYKLSDSGTLNYKNAINEVGEVYLTIGAIRSKVGKVSITVQGTMRELEALTDSMTDLKSGTIVEVLDVTSNGILIVDKASRSFENFEIDTEDIKQINS